jgi:hypothetical protein
MKHIRELQETSSLYFNKGEKVRRLRDFTSSAALKGSDDLAFRSPSHFFQD